LFNVVEGIVDHHILTVHHVRDDVEEPLPWDLGFLALGAALIAVGFAVYRQAERLTHAPQHATMAQAAERRRRSA
jgi:uncharacterized membrane protein